MKTEFLSLSKKSDILAYLSETKDVKIIAGGTDIIPQMRRGEVHCKTLLDISQCNELNYIKQNSEHKICVGALASHTDIYKNELIRKYGKILSLACRKIGSTQIRNRGTIGGNIINCAICADTIPALLVFDADLVLESIRGTRNISIEKFFQKRDNWIKEDELLTEINFPIYPNTKYKMGWAKVGRREVMVMSRLSLAVVAVLEDRIVRMIRIASGACLAHFQRLYNVENFLLNKNLSNELIQQSKRLISNELIRIGGTRWSTEYKEVVIGNLLERILRGL
ncbi:MAG: hypothetical protein DRH57_04225 [Candidatus Cloacimonadota bacterium]|nr:MAG: hypothetical protein DRH57_04225 [Candidatus Cloacimonadota bacterium]